jgi:hypothetical protein
MDKIGPVTNKVKIDMQVLLETYSLLQRINGLYDETYQAPFQGQVCLGQNKWVCIHSKFRMPSKNSSRIIGKNAHKVI